MERCGELALDEATDLSKDNLRNENKSNYL